MLSAPPEISWSSSALFLDVDGTLLNIAERPQDVAADRALIVILENVADALGGAMALVSGRPVADINRIFHPACFPASGAHGAEYQDTVGRGYNKAVETLPGKIVGELEALVASYPELLLEHKQHGVALHYRQAPGLQSMCHEQMNLVASEVEDNFRLIQGKMVYEITPRSLDKGVAIAEFLRAPPFRGRKPVYVGDDTTDEDAFVVVNRLSGISIRVGPTQPTEAVFALEDVGAVHSWLERIVRK